MADKKKTSKVARLYLSGIVYDEQSKGTEDYGVITKRQVIDFINANQAADEFIVTIHSRGGDVSEGFAIYDALKNSGKKITTIGEGLVASIATVFFMAGTSRKLTENTDFFIHCPWGEPWQMSGFTADDYEEMAVHIRQAEDKILNFYVKKTGADKELLSEYMKEEKTLSADQAVELKFATEIIQTNSKASKIGAVAYLGGFNKNKNKNSDTMSKEKLSAIEKSLNTLTSLFKNFGKKTKDETTTTEDAVLEITLDDDSIMVVDDPDGDGVPMVGDSVTIDGSAPDDGDYTDVDGTVYTVTSGMIESIVTASAEDDTEPAAEEKKKPAAKKPAVPVAKKDPVKPAADPEMAKLVARVASLEKSLVTAMTAKKKADAEALAAKTEKEETDAKLPVLEKAITDLTTMFKTLAKNTESDFELDDDDQGEDLSHHEPLTKSKGSKLSLADQAVQKLEQEQKDKAKASKDGKKKKSASIWDGDE